MEQPSFWGTIGWWLRAILLGITFCVVLWAFGVVFGRWLARDTGANANKVHLTLLQWGNLDETKRLNEIGKEFTKENPNIDVQILQTPDFDSKVFTMTAGKMAPDVFYVTDDNVSIWANLKMLHPLDEYIAEDVAKEGDAWIKDFYPHLYNWFKFDGTKEGSGPQYGLPAYQSPFVMAVNVDLFKRAGVKIPYDGWNWDEYDAAAKKINALSVDDTPTGRIYGNAIGSHQYGTRNWIWNHGAQLFGGPNDDEETTIKLGEPSGLAALKRIYDARFVSQTCYSTVGTGSAPAQGGKDMTMDLFCQGKIGIMGPSTFFLKNIKGKAKDIKWDVVPMPNVNREYNSTSIAIAWAVAAGSKHPKEAYKFARFLTGPKGQTMMAEKGYIFPTLQSVANSPAFLKQDEAPEHMDVFVKAAQNSRIPYWPRIKPFLSRFKTDLDQYTQYGKGTPEIATATLAEHWDYERNAPRNNPQGTPIGGPFLLAMLIIALVVVLGTIIYLITQQRGGWMAKQEMRNGMLFISPWLLGFLVFVLGPMVMSLVLSFTQWTPILPLEQARFVAGNNYQELFTADKIFRKSLQVTLYYSILAVPFTQIISLSLALLLVTKLKTISFFRSMYFMPSLIGGVVMASIGLRMFDNKAGMLNAVLGPILGIFHKTPPDWLGVDAATWAIPGLVLLSLWHVGGSMLIYLAALKGVPPDLHESASLDGATSWDKFVHITLPMISPIIQFNLIMGIIGSFKIFDVVKVMTGGGPNNDTMVYALQLYNEAFGSLHMGYASAMAWVLFAIILCITLLVFRAMRDRVYYESLK